MHGVIRSYRAGYIVICACKNILMDCRSCQHACSWYTANLNETSIMARHADSTCRHVGSYLCIDSDARVHGIYVATYLLTRLM